MIVCVIEERIRHPVYLYVSYFKRDPKSVNVSAIALGTLLALYGFYRLRVHMMRSLTDTRDTIRPPEVQSPPLWHVAMEESDRFLNMLARAGMERISSIQFLKDPVKSYLKTRMW